MLLGLLQQGLREGVISEQDYLEKVSELVNFNDTNMEALFEDQDDLSEIEDDEVYSDSEEEEDFFEKEAGLSLQDQAKSLKKQMPVLNKANLKQMQ